MRSFLGSFDATSQSVHRVGSAHKWAAYLILKYKRHLAVPIERRNQSKGSPLVLHWLARVGFILGYLSNWFFFQFVPTRPQKKGKKRRKNKEKKESKGSQHIR